MSTKCEHKTMNNAVLCTVAVLMLCQIGASDRSIRRCLTIPATGSVALADDLFGLSFLNAA